MTIVNPIYSVSQRPSDPLNPRARTSGVSMQANITRELAETSPGYLGFTNFSTVYQETESSLSLVHKSYGPASIDVGGHATTHRMEGLSHATMEKCLAILECIPDADVGFSLMSRNTNPNESWIRLAGGRMCESLYTTFKAQLESRNTVALQNIADLIARNTAGPWLENEADADKWLSSFSGRNIRWECIGMLFTYWFYGTNTTETHRPDLPSIRNTSMTPSQKQALGYKDAAERCLELCESSALNSLQLCLLFNLFIIEGTISGDASEFTTWPKT